MRDPLRILITALALAPTPAWADCPAGGVDASSLVDGGRYKVVGISPDDAFYGERGTIIGESGTFTEAGGSGCWISGRMTFDSGESSYFYQVELVASQAPIVAPPAPQLPGCPSGAIAHVRPGERVQVLHVHSEDAYASTRGQYEGRWGIAGSAMTVSYDSPCYFGGDFTFDGGRDTAYFYKVALTRAGGGDAKPKLATGADCPEGSYAGGIWPGQRVSVLAVHDKDAWKPEEEEITAQSGVVESTLNGNDCWLAGGVRTDDGMYRYFYKAAVGPASPKPPVVLGAPTRKNKIAKGTRVQIVDLDYTDSYSTQRTKMIGKQCTVQDELVETGPAWLGGHLTCGARTYSMFRVRVSETE